MKGNFNFNLKLYTFQLLFPHQPDAVLLIQMFHGEADKGERN